MAKPPKGAHLHKKLGNNSDSSTDEQLSHLSGAERDAYLSMMGKGPNLSVPQDSKDQTVSKVAHDSEVAELKQKIQKKEEKISELNKDREDLRGERDKYKSKMETAQAELASEKEKTRDLAGKLNAASDKVSSLEKEIKTLTSKKDETPRPADKTQIEELEKEVEKLNKALKAAQASVADLNADVEGKEATIVSLRETIADSNTDIQRLEEMLQSKNDEIERFHERPELTEEQSSAIKKMTAARITATDLFSESFSDGRYNAKLAKTGKYILLAPDVEGGAVCRNHTISLPRLAQLLPFEKPLECPLEDFGNNVLKMVFSE